MSETKLQIPEVLSGEGESRRMVRVRRACDECGEPAVYKHTYLLPDARRNPASSAYRHDDCLWCSDHAVFTCADCKRPSVDGYGWCSTFTAGKQFAHLFLEWKDAAPDPRIAAAEGMAKALDHIAFEPLTDDMEADAATCLAEAARVAREAIIAWDALK